MNLRKNMDSTPFNGGVVTPIVTKPSAVSFFNLRNLFYLIQVLSKYVKIKNIQDHPAIIFRV